MQKNNLSANYWGAHRIEQKAENQAWKTSRNQGTSAKETWQEYSSRFLVDVGKSPKEPQFGK